MLPSSTGSGFDSVENSVSSGGAKQIASISRAPLGFLGANAGAAAAEARALLAASRAGSVTASKVDEDIEMCVPTPRDAPAASVSAWDVGLGIRALPSARRQRADGALMVMLAALPESRAWEARVAEASVIAKEVDERNFYGGVVDRAVRPRATSFPPPHAPENASISAAEEDTRCAWGIELDYSCPLSFEEDAASASLSTRTLF
jgi:hypothetical protein